MDQADRSTSATGQTCRFSRSNATRRKPRHDDRREFRKRDGDGGNGRGLDDQQHRPAIKEAAERAKSLAQVDVLAARLRHHCGELAEAQRADERHHAGKDPDQQQQARAADLMSDIRGDEENAGADHRPGDDHRGVKKAQPFDEAFEPSACAG